MRGRAFLYLAGAIRYSFPKPRKTQPGTLLKNPLPRGRTDIRHTFWLAIPSGREPRSWTVILGVCTPREIQMNRSAQSGGGFACGVSPGWDGGTLWALSECFPIRSDRGKGPFAVGTPCGSHGEAVGSDTPCGGQRPEFISTSGSAQGPRPHGFHKANGPFHCYRRRRTRKRRHPIRRHRRITRPKTGLPAGAFPSKQEAVAPVAQSARAAAF